MLHRQGFTLIEILVVLIIIAVVAVFAFPNFITPTEQARALSAQNNLLAIYTAQRNYHNTNGSFATISTLALINSTLSLNIQDDGTYLYDCGVTKANACTASRTDPPPSIVITVALDAPINLNGEVNPKCVATNSNWCP